MIENAAPFSKMAFEISNKYFLDLQLPAYTPYPYPEQPLPTLPYPPIHPPLQDVWPPDSVEKSLRHHTYPRTSVQLARGITFDFDQERIQLEDEEEESVVKEEIHDEQNQDEKLESNISEIKAMDMQDTSYKSKEEERVDNVTSDCFLSLQRSGSLMFLTDSRRGSLISKYKSV